MTAVWYGEYGMPRRRQPKTDAQRAADLERALSIRARSRPIAGTPAERYLRSRGLRGDGGWPPSIRWADDAVMLPTPPVKSGIIIDVQSPETGEITGIHRTFFTRWGTVEKDSSGRKCKYCLGTIWGKAAVLDCPPDPDGRWGIAEGVETAMACRQL
jgi:hypothetical protein